MRERERERLDVVHSMMSTLGTCIVVFTFQQSLAITPPPTKKWHVSRCKVVHFDLTSAYDVSGEGGREASYPAHLLTHVQAERKLYREGISNINYPKYQCVSIQYEPAIIPGISAYQLSQACAA